MTDNRPDRLRWRHLTSEERGVICNGCGPKGWLLKVPDFVFHSACQQHDLNYWIGASKVQRKKADLQFLAEMIMEAAGKRVYIWLARIYYRAVRVFGGKCFHYAKKQRTKNQMKAYIAFHRNRHKLRTHRLWSKS